MMSNMALNSSLLSTTGSLGMSGVCVRVCVCEGVCDVGGTLCRMHGWDTHTHTDRQCEHWQLWPLVCQQYRGSQREKGGVPS